jgi:hypothetical protein
MGLAEIIMAMLDRLPPGVVLWNWTLPIVMYGPSIAMEFNKKSTARISRTLMRLQEAFQTFTGIKLNF